MHNEIKDALDRLNANIGKIRTEGFPHADPREEALNQVVIALTDVVAEIANVLPAPYRVPKE